MTQSTASAASSSPQGGAPARGRLQGDLDQAASALFQHFLEAFQAFNGLRELAEDMRILSLNAELAAGRAGNAGVAVRALTQYTRQLVRQLNKLEEEMEELRIETDGLSNRAIEDLKALRRMRSGEMDSLASDRTVEQLLGDTEQSVRKMLDHTRDLGAHAGRIRQVAEHSTGIATNIAIEAAAAGRYEGEFRTVADTMRRYVESLRSMVDQADRALRQADEGGRRLATRLTREG